MRTCKPAKIKYSCSEVTVIPTVPPSCAYLLGEMYRVWGFEAGRYMTYLQWGDEDVVAHWRQLISTVLQGGRLDRIWPGCFDGVLSLEQPVDVPLCGGVGRHCRGPLGGGPCWAGGGWGGELELENAVIKDGLRTVPQVVQVVGQAWVFDGEWGGCDPVKVCGV